MEPNFWLGRWQRGETGWHQDEVEPGLIAGFAGVSPTRVLVPLCGKSLDLAWLASQGHEVIGVELSPMACEAFFSENKIPFTKSGHGAFTRYQSERLTILNGNFFDLSANELGRIGAIYDRAALIALPLELREKYAAHLTQLVKTCGHAPDFHFLQIILQRTPQDEKGPPFSISPSELERLYSQSFELRHRSSERLPALATEGSEKPAFERDEHIFQLAMKT
jgi:thiopurine S-methyltransferase